MSRRARFFVYAFGAALVAGSGALGWYITQRASQNRALVVSSIGDVTLAYAPAYARFGGGRRMSASVICLSVVSITSLTRRQLPRT